MELAAAPTSANVRASSRMIQLDVLRGTAILLVLGRHAVVDPSRAGWLRWPARLWEHLGWTGVDLFFVLSGFLVGGLLLSELRTRGSLDVRRFIIRRGFKIWPAYYVLVLGSLFIDAFHLGWGPSLKLYWPNLLHLQNYFGASPLGITWTLAVEEHFYLLLPLVLWVLTARGRRRGAVDALPYIAVAVMVGCNAMRLHNLRRPYTDQTHLFPTHLRIDGLAMGVLLAYWHHFRPEFLRRMAQRRWTLLIVGAALLSPMAVLSVQSKFVWTIGFTFLYLGYACILTALVYTPVGSEGGIWGQFFSRPVAKFVASIGFFSYSIYLWHIDLSRHPIQRFIANHPFGGPATIGWVFWMAVYVLCAYVIGVLLGRLIELPALGVRDRLFPSRSAALRSNRE